MATSFKRSHTCTVSLSALNPAADHHQPTPLLETPGPSWASMGQSLVGSLFLSPVSWCAQGFVCVPQEFPQSVYVLAAVLLLLLLLLSRFSGV